MHPNAKKLHKSFAGYVSVKQRNIILFIHFQPQNHLKNEQRHDQNKLQPQQSEIFITGKSHKYSEPAKLRNTLTGKTQEYSDWQNSKY